MNSPIEKQLEALSPRGLSPQARLKLDKVIDGLAAELPQTSEAPVEETAKIIAFPRLAQIAVAASVALVIGAAFLTNSLEQPQESPQAAQIAPAADFELVENSQEIGTAQTEKVATAVDSEWPLREVRKSVVSRQYFIERKSGLTLTLSEHSQEVVLVPETSF